MAPAQPTFSDLEASLGRAEPHYPKAGGRRPPAPLGTMLRMYVVQVAFQLSDEGTEDARASRRRMPGRPVTKGLPRAR